MEDMVFLLLLIEIYYLNLIWCIVPEISKWFQKEGYFYFAREKSGQRQIGLDTGGKPRAESILNGSQFCLPNYTTTISNLISKYSVRAPGTTQAATFQPLRIPQIYKYREYCALDNITGHMSGQLHSSGQCSLQFCFLC